jgi:hypothetical protein
VFHRRRTFGRTSVLPYLPSAPTLGSTAGNELLTVCEAAGVLMGVGAGVTAGVGVTFGLRVGLGVTTGVGVGVAHFGFFLISPIVTTVQVWLWFLESPEWPVFSCCLASFLSL